MCDFDNDYDGLDWDDWMIIGPLSEDIADEKRRRQELEREMFGDDDDIDRDE